LQDNQAGGNLVPLYYDDLHVGMSWTTPARTISEHDLLLFAGLTGDMHPLHTDAEYCRKTAFGERIAHGFLVASIASGLGFRLRITEGTIVANLGTSWKFVGPVKIGDTIHVVITVSEMRVSKSDPTVGVLKREFNVRNQRGETTAIGEVSVLAMRNAESRPAVAS
jgi:acyl dehydratase